MLEKRKHHENYEFNRRCKTIAELESYASDGIESSHGKTAQVKNEINDVVIKAEKIKE